MRDYSISEEDRANRMALRQMGELNDYDDDFGNNFEDHFNSNEEELNIGRISKRIAKAAFNSEDASRDYLKEVGNSVWDSIRELVKQPAVKEALIIGGVMLFKIGLFFSYKKARREGLDIIDI